MLLQNIIGCILLAGCFSINSVEAQCFSCNSLTDENCAGRQYNSKPTKKCDQKDELCFTLSYEGKAMRGCYSEFPSYCTEESCNAKYCKGLGCNREPIITLKCIRCSGINCTSVSDIKPTLCKYYMQDNECYTYATNKNNIERGCASDVFDSDLITKTGYIGCKREGCNNEEYIEPKPTLKCIKCSGKDCVFVSEKTATLCKNYDLIDECYTNAINEENVIRGCKFDDNVQCGKDFCIPCKGNGCNNKSGIVNYSCNVCQGNSKHCMGETGKKEICEISTPADCRMLLGRSPRCFTHYKLNEFERGCGYNFNTAYDNNFTEFCNEENCNSKCATNCYECNSSSDTKCKQNFEELHRTTCLGTTYCHECEDRSGVLSRGCGKKKYDYERCNNCHDNNFCNKKKPITCLSCSSDKDPGCIILPNVSTIKEQECDNVFDVCVSKIYETLTVRGCEKTCYDPSSKTCKTCDEDLCNKNVIPENRAFCHKCADETDCLKSQEFNTPTVCERYIDGRNRCFIGKERNVIIRGCESDHSHDICYTHGNECQYCDSSRGCNSEEIKGASKCISCNDNNECGWAQYANQAVECEFNLLGCFTKINDGKTIERGCFRTDTCNDHPDTCFRCNGDACNIKSVFQQKCIQCDSLKNGNCAKGNEITPTVCTAKPTSFSNHGCYTMHDGKKIVRGCASELPDIQECDSENNKNCHLCREQGCNNKPAAAESMSSIKCIQCNDAEQCPWGFTEDSAKKCTDFQGKCFRYNYDNSTVIRGCGDYNSVCDPEGKKCMICYKDGCNNENVVSHACYQCQSDKDETKTCANKAEDIQPKLCSALQTYEKRGCYTKTDKKIVSRGCIIDLAGEEFTTCRADKEKKSCDWCFESKCNNKKPPNGGSLLTHFSFMSLITISVLVTVKNQI